jgi:hypothetical protein
MRCPRPEPGGRDNAAPEPERLLADLAREQAQAGRAEATLVIVSRAMRDDTANFVRPLDCRPEDAAAGELGL